MRLLLLFTALALVSACASSPRQVRGELPLVTLDGLQREDDQVILSLGLRNINDQALPLSELEVRLSVGGGLLLNVVHLPDFEIGPRGREVLTLRGRGDAAGLQVLERLESAAGRGTDQGLASSTDFAMTVRLANARGRSRTAEVSGFVHPVPGRPGRFR